MGHHNDKVVAGLICGNDVTKVREAVCIQVEKVYDSCKERDCIEDAKVIFWKKRCIQKIIDEAINVKVRKAEVLDVYADVEQVPFKKGFFTVDVKFFIRVTLDFFVPGSGFRNGPENGVNGPLGTRIITVNGLVVFDKKIILFGSDGGVKIFKSHYVADGIDTPIRSRLQQDNLPISKVEVAEPIALTATIQDIADKMFEDNCNHIDNMPRSVGELIVNENLEAFENDEDEDRIPRKRVVVSLGLFSIIKLVRFVQLLIPAFDFCVPNKECIAATEENPCVLFDTIDFPVDEFFPPQKFDFPGALEAERRMTDEMCSE